MSESFEFDAATGVVGTDDATADIIPGIGAKEGDVLGVVCPIDPGAGPRLVPDGVAHPTTKIAMPARQTAVD